MPWLPFSHASPAGPCVLIGANGIPIASNPHYARQYGSPDGWFISMRDLGPWMSEPFQRLEAGWIVIDRRPQDDDIPTLPFIVLRVTKPAYFSPWFGKRWATLPPWPTTAHARLEAFRIAGLTPV